MDLYRICYRARIDRTWLNGSLETELDQALGRIRRTNRVAGVTGALFLGRTHVMQLLEGGTGPVLETLYHIMQDQRLEDMEAVCHEPVAERSFPASLMFFRDLRGIHFLGAAEDLCALLDRNERLDRAHLQAFLDVFAPSLSAGHATRQMMLV
ncbi:hypothetical protein GCM10011316_12360 [Roseibium aquae]|uniref:BLUF domain-containing protein n=1 Tax=Roseibium aquae TaxID=1323746 RepID=A0A916WXN8_9HYPH|nr:BLUF domain-containing protein [Roseibium aquae]GGB41917.1 hypothetical protein GCM10011316_12360 [Roseibium aquae]